MNKMMNLTERISSLLSTEGSGLFKVKIDKTVNEFEQAYTFFKPVYGLEETKENVYLNLTSVDQINTLLVGPPATSKSLFLKIIKENCKDVIFFDAATGSTGAGLITLLSNNKKARVLLIDEIDKLKKNDANVILGLLNDGSVHKDLKDDSEHFKMNVKVFATANSTKKLGKAFMSRMEVYHIPEYSDEEFVDVVTHCLDGEILMANSVLIAKVLIAHEMKDIRKALSIAKKLKGRNFTTEQVVRVIENLLKMSTDKVVDYN